MVLKKRVFGVTLFLSFFVFICSAIYSGNIGKDKLNPENIILNKLESFNTGVEEDETRYDKIRSRTFYEKVNSLLKNKKRYIPEVLNNSLLKGVIVDDFQVNDDKNVGTFIQYSPEIDLNKSGQGVICWSDDRNGDRDIFAQRIAPGGNLLGENFRVNDDESSAVQSEPRVCIFDDGSFVICWVDERNGNNDPDIYAQSYNSNGETLGDNFKVNDDNIPDAFQFRPAIDGAGDGFFVICWNDGRVEENNGDIYAQRYDSTGASIDSNFAVYLGDDVDLPQEYPDVAVQDNHSFVVCWEHTHRIDIFTAKVDIFMQIFTPTGSGRGGNIQVNEEGFYYPSNPKVSVNEKGFCAVCWIEGRDVETAPDIYARLLSINPGGGFFGNNFKVNADNLEDVIQIYPDVSVADDTTYVISWLDFRNGADDLKIYCQIFEKTDTPASEDILVSDANVKVVQYKPTIGISENGSIIFCWEDERSGDNDIFMRRFVNNNAAGESSKINDDTGANQSNPRISVSSEGDFVISWDDRRNGESDIDVYLQRYNSSIEAVGENVMANDDNTGLFQTYSSVSFLNDTNFVVAWQDHRNGLVNPDIYYQMFKITGGTIGQNVKVNDDQIVAYQMNPDVKSFSDGSFIMCWSDDRNGENDDDIYAQRFSFSGAPIETNFRVNDVDSQLFQFFPTVGVSSNGYYGFCWQDLRDYFFNIYAQIYDSLYTEVGKNFKVNEDVFAAQSFPDIDFDSNGNYVICWADRRNGDDDSDIYAQMYSANGNKIGDNFRVNDDQPGASQANPSISAADDGMFVICWEDERNGTYNSDIYAQCYDSEGNTIGWNIKVNSDQTLKVQVEPDVAVDNNKNIYFVWKDSRNQGSGYDIFAKVISWDVFTKISDDEISENIPVKYMLYQNYPNPFNPTTNIEYSIPKEENVIIKVYSINGILVKTLLNKKQPTGFYTVSWDGTNDFGITVSSGVYFVNMRAGIHNISKKMVFLR